MYCNLIWHYKHIDWWKDWCGRRFDCWMRWLFFSGIFKCQSNATSKWYHENLFNLRWDKVWWKKYQWTTAKNITAAPIWSWAYRPTTTAPTPWSPTTCTFGLEEVTKSWQIRNFYISQNHLIVKISCWSRCPIRTARSLSPCSCQNKCLRSWKLKRRFWVLFCCCHT